VIDKYVEAGTDVVERIPHDTSPWLAIRYCILMLLTLVVRTRQRFAAHASNDGMSPDETL